MDKSGSPKRHEDTDISDAESSISGKSGKSGASSLLSRRSPTRSGLSITSGRNTEDLKTYKDLLLQRGYHITGVLGRGQNSGFVVHSATKDGETFAVKVSTECDEEGTNGATLRREHQILSRLSHENIVKVSAMWNGEVGDGVPGAAMVLEYCKGSTLSRHLPFSSHREVVSHLAWRRSCLQQLAIAVAYLRSMSLEHRDLHARNVMVEFPSRLEASPSESPVVVKVVDFGCSAPTDCNKVMEEDVNVNILPVGSTKPCDVFALGLLGVALLAGKEICSWGVVPPEGSELRLPPCGLKEFRLAKPFEDYLRTLLDLDSERRLKAQDAVDKLPEDTRWLIPKKVSL